MAVEAKRGCGYRKVGGLYMVGGGTSRECGRMPLPLTVCRCCGAGIKQARGWTWINPAELFADIPCKLTVYDCAGCPLFAINKLEKAGLLWVGTAHYPTPRHFTLEDFTLGISKRIRSVPKGFTVGEDWVFLAHPKTMPIENDDGEQVMGPGVFRVWKPERIEKIITESEFKDEDAMAKLEKRGITPVVVPDDDKDHQ